MPDQQAFSITDFRAGWHPELAPTAVPAGGCVDCANVRGGRGTLRLRPPRRRHTDLYDGIIGGVEGDGITTYMGPMRAITQYVDHRQTPHARLVIACGQSVYASQDAGQTLHVPLKLRMVLSPIGAVRFQQFHQHLYILDGSSRVSRWAGGSSYGTVTLEKGVGPAPVVDETTHYTGTTGCLYTFTVTRGGFVKRSGMDDDEWAQFKFVQEGGSGTSVSGIDVTETTAIDDGVVLRWPNVTFVEGDVYKLRCYDAAYVEVLTDIDAPSKAPEVKPTTLRVFADCKSASRAGVGPIASSTDTFRPNFLADSTFFQGDPTQNYATAEPTAIDDYIDLCVRQLTDPSYVQTGSSAVAFEVLYSAEVVGFWARDTDVWCRSKLMPVKPLQLANAAAIAMTYQVLAGPATGLGDCALFVEFAADDDTEHLRWVKKVSLSGAEVNTWQNVTIDISDIPASDRAGIRYVQLSWFCSGMTSVPRVDTIDDPLAGKTYRMDDLALATTLVLDRMEVVDANLNLPSGEYKFSFGYAPYTGAGYKDGPQSPVSSVTLSDEKLVNFTITCEIDPAHGLTKNDMLYVYARGGFLSEWRRIATIRVKDGSFSYETTWDGSLPDNAPLLTPYVKAPPAGITNCFQHRGRMCYLKDEKLYVSNLQAPEACPDMGLAQSYDDYGFLHRVDEGGAQLQAGAGTDAVKVIVTSRGVYLFEGENSNTFLFSLADDTHGTMAPDSVVSIGGMVVWLDLSGSVCAWDGQRVLEVGATEEATVCPVRDYVRALTAEQRENAYGCYDPFRRAYVLAFPSMEPTDAPNGLALYYALDDNAWWKDTQTPATGLLAAPDVATPGVYAIHARSLRVWRLYESVAGETNVAEDGLYLIPLYWRSGTLGSDVMAYADVAEIWLHRTVQSLQTGCAISVYNPLTATVAASRAVEPDTPRIYRWRPPLIPNMREFQLVLGNMAGINNGAQEISGLTVQPYPRGGMP